MTPLASIAELEALYGTPGEAAMVKVTARLTPAYRTWIERARLCILSTVGPDGTDASPRGDEGPVVTVLDAGRLALPDWRGNQRLDSLRNIVADGRVSLMFIVPGSTTVIRVNGRAVVTADDALRAQFARGATLPATVIVIDIAEVYPQCARALMRSETWTSGDCSAGLPSVGDMLREITEGGFDGTAYDADWPGRAAKSMW